MSWRAALAYFVIVVPILVAASAYVEYPTVFGDWPYAKLIALTAASAGIASALFATEYNERLWVVLPGGILAGIGGAVIFAMYVDSLSPRGRMTQWYDLLFLIGAIPGFLLIWVLRRIVHRKRDQRAA